MGTEEKDYTSCDSCFYDGSVLVEYRRPGEWNEELGKFDVSNIKLCLLCANTMIGRSKKDEVKKLFGSNECKALTIQELGQAVCHIGNEIIKAINELKGDK